MLVLANRQMSSLPENSYIHNKEDQQRREVATQLYSRLYDRLETKSTEVTTKLLLAQLFRTTIQFNMTMFLNIKSQSRTLYNLRSPLTNVFVFCVCSCICFKYNVNMMFWRIVGGDRPEHAAKLIAIMLDDAPPPPTATRCPINSSITWWPNTNVAFLCVVGRATGARTGR